VWTTYLLCSTFLVIVVLGPLVVVLAIVWPLFVLWRSHARSKVVPFVICGSDWFDRFGVHLPPSCVRVPLVHLVPCLPDVLSRPGFRKKLSLMSPPRETSRSSVWC